MPDVKEQVNRVERTFMEHGLSFEHCDSLEQPVVRLVFGGGDYSFTHVIINVVFDEDGESVQIVTSPIANVPAERTAQLLLTLNDCNCKYRWVKFYLDGDNDVIADADTLFNEFDVGPVVMEMVMRVASIIDEAYATIMKAIWG